MSGTAISNTSSKPRNVPAHCGVNFSLDDVSLCWVNRTCYAKSKEGGKRNTKDTYYIAGPANGRVPPNKLLVTALPARAEAAYMPYDPAR